MFRLRKLREAKMMPTRYLPPLLVIITCLTAKGHAAPTSVNGTWSSWSSWTDCSATCGNGDKQRSRECNNPAPDHGGLDCEGSSNETVSCLIKQCPINGMWSDWSSWTGCSATCGEGTRLRSRECNNPIPAHGGLQCEGMVLEFSSCSIKPCPINGMWSEWSTWTDCSAPCGNGERLRGRECDNPAPDHGGLDCVGSGREVLSCVIKPCPINGMWSEWSTWTDCSAPCGNGERLRGRECDNPAPDHGGLDCVGSGREVLSCIIKPCPIHGGWSQWGAWIDECSATECKQKGLQLRRRACTDPKPKHGGRHCRGQYYGSKECINTAACPVDGQWGAWGNFGDCSATCGFSIRKRSRECNNPEPKNNGKYCTGGTGVLAQPCQNLPSCPPAPTSPTANGCADDEDAECELSGSGSKPLANPCEYFTSSYNYAECKDGHLTPPPDVPGNEDGLGNKDDPEDGGPNPLAYSEYSLQYDNTNPPEAVDMPEEGEEAEPAPNNNPLDYSQYSVDISPENNPTKQPQQATADEYSIDYN